MTEYLIDELARAAGTTTRNVRAYQQRGLLPSPRRQGRAGVYDDDHLARLRLIASMLARGYAMSHIAELLGAWEQGKELSAVLGLEQAVAIPWDSDVPVRIPTAAVADVLGVAGAEMFDHGVAIGLITVNGDSSTITSPRLLDAIVRTFRYGFTPAELAGLSEQVVPPIDEVAKKMVQAAVERLTAEHGEVWMPDAAELDGVAEMVVVLREAALTAVQVFFAQAAQRHIDEMLGVHIGRLVEASRPQSRTQTA